MYICSEDSHCFCFSLEHATEEDDTVSIHSQSANDIEMDPVDDVGNAEVVELENVMIESADMKVSSENFCERYLGVIN